MTERVRVAICAIAKNEGPYLAEWVAYHRIIGFDHILLYDNESTDDTPRVCAELEARGHLSVVKWSAPPRAHVQRLSYRDGLKRLRPEFDWITFIDLDEFIVLPHHDGIHDFLSEYGWLNAIAMNWKLFGTSGQAERQPGLVMGRFRRCALEAHSGNRAVKTLARVSAFNDVNLHNHHFHEGVRYRTVSGEEIPPNTGKSSTVTHDVIRVNHYFTKSREEWDEKVARGRATKPAGHPDKMRTERHFTMHDRNEDIEVDVLDYIPKVKAFLAGTSLLPGEE